MIAPCGADWLLLGWAAACAADQRALGGRQLHQPIVAAVGAGMILGCLDQALLVGIWMQSVWSVPMPVGGKVLPDTGSAAVAAVAVAGTLPGISGFGAAILIGLLVAWISMPWERSLRRGNERREEKLFEVPSSNPGRVIGLGIIGTGLRGIVCVAVARFAALGIVDLAGSAAWSSLGGEGIEGGVVGAASCLALVTLGSRFRAELGRRWIGWTLAGLFVGATGHLLVLLGGR